MGNSDKEKSKVIRKRDPAKRKDIHVVTLKKIENFLKEQQAPIFKSELVRLIGVNYDSLNIALEMLPIKTDSEGKIYLPKKEEKKNV